MPNPSGGSYWRDSRAPRYSLLFALPLLAGYEVLADALARPAGGLRNGADVMLRQAFASVAGPVGPIAFEILLIAFAAALVVRDLRRHRGPLARWMFAAMAAEACILALACGVVVGTVTARLLAGTGLALPPGPITATPWPVRLMLSLGAGLYEELLFRVILVGALAWAARRLLGLPPLFAGTGAVLLGALAFSAVHYVGAYGDPFTLYSFAFRAIAGVFFSALYLTRGFGITAWTHALYDVVVLVF